MVVQNFKTEPKNCVESQEFIDTASEENIIIMRKKKSLFPKFVISVALGIILTSLLLVNVTVLFMALNKNNKIRELKDEINILKRDVNSLKYHFGIELFNEIINFEKESASDLYSDNMDDTEASGNGPDPYFEDIDFDENYDFPNYDAFSSDEQNNVEFKATTSIPSSSINEDVNRSKREVLAATIDGVPIIAESYAERKHRNKTSFIPSGEGLKLYETLGKNTESPPRNYEQRKHHAQRTYHTTGWAARTYVNHGRDTPVLPSAVPTPVMTRSSRFMHTDEDKTKAFRRVVKKSFLKSSGSTGSQKNMQELVENTAATESSKQIHRHKNHSRKRSNIETMDERLPRIPAAHYNGDTSKYRHGTHHHYKGDSHLAYPDGKYIDWVPSSWVKSLGMDYFFEMYNGVLTIKESGIYFIYAQIYYADEHDTNGYRIYKNDSGIAQCTTMTHTTASIRPIIKRNTCYTATIEYLEKGDRIIVRDIETMRYSYFEYGKSFFGIYKISEAKIK